MSGLRRAVFRVVFVLLLGQIVIQTWGTQAAVADAPVWVRQFHFEDGTWTKGIAADASGIYVVGESFRSGGHAFHGFLTKYDFDGDRLWSRFHFGPQDDPVTDVAAGPSGVYVLASVGQPHATEWRLRRYHRDGDLVWSHPFDQYTTPAGLAVDASGVYVVGRVSFLPRHSRHARLESFATKISATGKQLWFDRFGTTSGANGVSQDADGFTVVGTASDGLWGNGSAGGTDAYIRRYSPDGVSLWTRQFGTTGDDEATAVAGDATGQYVAGVTGDGPQTSFVRKFDPAGRSLWHHRLSRDVPFTNVTSAIPALSGTGVNVAGSGRDLSGGTGASGDGFVRGYDADGEVVFTDVIGTADADGLDGIASSAGATFVAGTTQGAFPGYPTPHYDDAFVARVA
jgi:hypothetical protein